MVSGIFSFFTGRSDDGDEKRSSPSSVPLVTVSVALLGVSDEVADAEAPRSEGDFSVGVGGDRSIVAGADESLSSSFAGDGSVTLKMN